jgi:hypothetical protein
VSFIRLLGLDLHFIFDDWASNGLFCVGLFSWASMELFIGLLGLESGRWT